MNKKVDEKQERTWALFCHIGALAGFIFPFGNIIAPLVIWLIKKEEYPLVDDQGKESVNFQIGRYRNDLMNPTINKLLVFIHPQEHGCINLFGPLHPGNLIKSFIK